MGDIMSCYGDCERCDKDKKTCKDYIKRKRAVRAIYRAIKQKKQGDNYGTNTLERNKEKETTCQTKEGRGKGRRYRGTDDTRGV